MGAGAPSILQRPSTFSPVAVGASRVSDLPRPIFVRGASLPAMGGKAVASVDTAGDSSDALSGSSPSDLPGTSGARVGGTTLLRVGGGLESFGRVGGTVRDSTPVRTRGNGGGLGSVVSTRRKTPRDTKSS